jgi:hypothetical protein
VAPDDPHAVDVAAVGAAQVAQDPFPVLAGDQLAVAAADGVVGEGELAALAPDERGVVRQFKPPAFVRTL